MCQFTSRDEGIAVVKSDGRVIRSHHGDTSIIVSYGNALLQRACSSHGLLNETIVYCAGEFGRTPGINSQGGRDHWAQTMSVLLAGGGFKRGFVFGSTDKSGVYPESEACSPADINATLLQQIGIMPETKLTTRSGRPMPLFRDARILHELGS